MKWIELKEILDNEFPPMAADLEWDCIGEQLPVKKEISKVMVTLDITVDVIAQAQEKGVELIITHHPLIFGDIDEVLDNDRLTNAKYQLLHKSGIGVYVMHTNADFNPNSIAYMQGLALNLEDLEQGNENKYVTGKLTEPMQSGRLINLIKELLELEDIEFRSNFDIDEQVEKVW